MKPWACRADSHADCYAIIKLPKFKEEKPVTDMPNHAMSDSQHFHYMLFIANLVKLRIYLILMF